MFTIDPSDGRRRPPRDRGRVRPRRGGRLGQRLARPLRGRQGRRCHVVTRDVQPQGARDRAAARTAGTRHARARRATRRLRPCSTDDEVRTARRARAARSRSTTARRRTPSGRSTPTASVWMLQSRPVTASGGDGSADARRPTARPWCAASAPRRAARAGAVRRPRRARGRRARSSDGDVLVTHMTAPDWVPLMRRAAAIVTDSGGMTCHAAIVSRELGIPCVVGTGDATTKLRDGELVTVDADARRRRSRASVATAARGRRLRRPSPPPRRGAGDGDAAARQPLRALAGRARGGARRRRRRPAARGADGDRGARGRPPAAAARAGPRRRVRRADGRAR